MNGGNQIMATHMDNRNRYALITGATSGFGFEFAKLFARDGYNLVLVARDPERLKEVSDELAAAYEIDARIIAEDLFTAGAAEGIYNKTKIWDITVDVLVNDAGQGEYGKFIDSDFARDVDIIQLNIISVVGLTKYFLKDMVMRNEGKVLQVASLLAKYPTPLMAVYGATKAFVLSLAEALINELKDTNVTMTVLLPGAADTDFFHKAGAEETVTYRETDLSAPEDVAKDGYHALMKGESKVISGAKNKMQAAMSTILPDTALASTMRKQMEPSEKEEGRDQITHPASREERLRIEEETGKIAGDYQDHDDHIHKQ
jgi:short-subunit dehydrogenase